jgi:DNA-binding NarL/FixJ family response regulator
MAIKAESFYLPQVAETKIAQSQDAPSVFVSYHKTMMTRVYVADGKTDERSALRLLLLDLNMDVVGQGADWETTLMQVPLNRTEMLLIDWNLLPNSPTAALDELRRACPAMLVIVLISHLDARQQATLSSGADAFISKGETPDRVAERLRSIAASVRTR